MPGVSSACHELYVDRCSRKLGDDAYIEVNFVA